MLLKPKTGESLKGDISRNNLLINLVGFQNGDTALHIASRNVNPWFVRALLVFDADTSIANNEGDIPLKVAMKMKNKPQDSVAYQSGMSFWIITC